ncbi:MAG: hypothetical protein OEZ22_00730 [Spirochaetia bacterium]|nr:hypothetical protein [Spirochaetia bacterium]
MKKYIKYMIFFYLLSCGKVIVKRELPNKEYATAKKGDIIVSFTKLDVKANNEEEVIFAYWRFMGADSSEVEFYYEEYFGQMKKKADLVETKKFSIQEEKIDLGNGTLIVYELTEGTITYTYDVNIK